MLWVRYPEQLGFYLFWRQCFGILINKKSALKRRLQTGSSHRISRATCLHNNSDYVIAEFHRLSEHAWWMGFLFSSLKNSLFQVFRWGGQIIWWWTNHDRIRFCWSHEELVICPWFSANSSSFAIDLSVNETVDNGRLRLFKTWVWEEGDIFHCRRDFYD